MSITAAIYADYQASNPEKFDEHIVHARREEERSLKSFFEDFFNSIKHKGLKFIGCEVITDESKFGDIVQSTTKSIESQDTRMNLICSKFEVQANENEPLEVVEFNIFFPKLIDDFYFKLAGNKYYAVYQLTDRNFYYAKKGLYLKTLLMPLGLHPKMATLNTEKGNHYSFIDFGLDYFKSNSSSTKTPPKNIFLHYFIKFGVYDTIKYFFSEGDFHPVTVLKEDMNDALNNKPLSWYLENENYDVILLNKGIYLAFYNKNYRQPYIDIVGTIAGALMELKRFEFIDNIDYWKRKIANGVMGAVAKADRGILSLERILENRTKRNLVECFLPDNKKDVYAILRWMMWNFYSLREIDSVDIYQRRIRLYEYLLFPLLKKTSKVSYRILNSRTVDNKRIKTLFSNTNPYYVIHMTLINNLIRYSNSSSNLTLFSSLKWSAKGSQTIAGEEC